jgi:site-specific DNA-methyltransferase (adenine-specific)
VTTKQVLVGDAASTLRQLPERSIDMVLTSPPYFRLRDYQVSGQLGGESRVDEWADQIQTVCRQLQRVLLPTGSLWLNLGDSYSLRPAQGAPRKSLLLGPERIALGLIRDGWLLRNKIIWQKANPMPSSVRDRLSCTWEVIYVFTRQRHYFFDLDAIRLPHTTGPSSHRRSTLRRASTHEPWRGPNAAATSGLDLLKTSGLPGHPLGKNPGDVWRIASSNYRGAHHATFPLELARRAIQAGSPEARCTACRLPWQRQLLRPIGGVAVRSALGPSCDCSAEHEPAVVLDPFFGAGTTGLAAEQLDRDWLGIELNPDFAELAEQRIQASRPAA